MPLSYDLTPFQILWQKFVKFSLVFWSERWHQKDILKLTGLYIRQRKQFREVGSKSVKNCNQFDPQDESSFDFAKALIKA